LNAFLTNQFHNVFNNHAPIRNAKLFAPTVKKPIELSNSSNNIKGIFDYKPGKDTKLNCGFHMLEVVFIPFDERNYQSVSQSKVVPTQFGRTVR
jgi:hypothetical protein